MNCTTCGDRIDAKLDAQGNGACCLKQCSECGETGGHLTLNNLDQCSECSIICELCGVSSNREPIANGICNKCEEKESKNEVNS